MSQKIVFVEKDESVSFEEFEQVITRMVQSQPITNEQLKKNKKSRDD